MPLSALLQAMIRSSDARVLDASDPLFFLAPESSAARALVRARESRPTCLVAVDYLFWLVQADSPSRDAREKRLAAGLDLLDAFSCPVLLGEVPSVQGAGTGDPEKTQGTGPAARRALNARIADWAASRRHVFLVPLENRLSDLRAGTEIQAGNTRWQAPDALSEILQEDGLHPTILGSSLVAALALETLVENGLVAAEDLDLDARKAARAVVEARTAERE